MNNTGWTPTSTLSGGRWAFHAVLVKHMQKLRARLAEPKQLSCLTHGVNLSPRNNGLILTLNVR
jgi:hypothetical protein